MADAAGTCSCVELCTVVFVCVYGDPLCMAAASGAGGGAGATVSRAATAAAAAGTEDAVKRINAMTSAKRKEAFLA